MPLHPPAPCACERASQRVPRSPQPANPRAPDGKPCPYADGARELAPRAPCSEPSAPPAGPSLPPLLLGPNPGAPRGASSCRESLSLWTRQAPWGPCVRGSALGLAARARASSLHRAHDCTDCALETRAVLVRCSFGADGRTRGLAGAILSASVARVCFCRRWASQELQSCSRHGQACARRQRCDIEY